MAEIPQLRIQVIPQQGHICSEAVPGYEKYGYDHGKERNQISIEDSVAS